MIGIVLHEPDDDLEDDNNQIDDDESSADGKEDGLVQEAYFDVIGQENKHQFDVFSEGHQEAEGEDESAWVLG